jgi:hypothetical protein
MLNNHYLFTLEAVFDFFFVFSSVLITGSSNGGSTGFLNPNK